MKIMAKFTSHHSTYDGDGNRQKGASFFFSENFWKENENLYKSDNGDLVPFTEERTQGPNQIPSAVFFY